MEDVVHAEVMDALRQIQADVAELKTRLPAN
jgi:hypothetical protein